MGKELYFDISSAESGGSLYRITERDGTYRFYYNYSKYDENADELTVFEADYADFDGFWAFITKDPEWYYLHPLYVHPDKRAFVERELNNVDWGVHPDKKWQESHRRQWRKVLADPAGYYRQNP